MATILETPISPISPMSAHHYPSMYHHASKGNLSHVEISHLSGATMADLIHPSVDRISSAASIYQSSNQSGMANSNRCSVASTTKSSLRRTNHLLLEMMQNITTELAAQRTIMLDIQHRVSHLEHESVENDPPLSALRALEGRRSKRNSTLVPPEGQQWWEACQNFARNSEEPMSAKEFLRTPKRFSGFGWKYGPASAKTFDTPPATPPAVDDVPPLTPTSEVEGDETELCTPPRHNIEFKVEEMVASTPKVRDEELDVDVKEHVIEASQKSMPTAPILMPPPVGKAVSVHSKEVVAPLQPLDNPQRYYKGMRSLKTYKALMKNMKTDKEHYILIHFHKRADLKGLES